MGSGSGSDIPLIQNTEPSNSRARLSHATLRFFSLTENCHTQIFYLGCFKSDFDAIKSKFGLLIEKIKKTPQIEDNLENEDDHKNEDDLKNEDNLKNEDDLKNEEDLPSKIFLPPPLP